ncbi:MAG: hypothetical protein N2491_10015 [Negativicutes bacterium]|nr:hypothetical protein [Negativicutes bacterium]
MDTIKCPQCGNLAAAGNIRCPRCNALLLAPCSGSCSQCAKKNLCK